MDTETTIEIRRFATDKEQTNSFLALMSYYGVTNLMSISEEQGKEFLAKLQSGEIRIPREERCI